MYRNNRELAPKNLIHFFLGITFLLIISSCEEDPNSLGSELLSDNSKIEVFYDTSVTFNGYLTDDEVFITQLNGYPSLGVINDPYFGSIKSSFATSMIPTSLFITFGNVEADSSVLYVVIDSTYGEFDYSKGYKAYKLNKSLEYDNIYYDSTSVEDFIDISNPISLNSRIIGDTLLVLTLNDEFSNFLIPPVDSIYYYRTVNQFLEKYFGIALIPDENNDNNGILLNIDLYNTNSKLTLYYEDTVSYDYKFYSPSGYHLNFSQHEKDHKTGIVNDFIENDQHETDSLLFIQGLGGMNSKIIISNFSNFIEDYKYSIINAKLIIPVKEDLSFSTFYPPEKLYFLSNTSDSVIYQIDDYVNNNFFGGEFDDKKSEYTFDISQHFAGLVNNEYTDSVLFFRMINSSIYPHRAIINLKDIKLKVTYTKH